MKVFYLEVSWLRWGCEGNACGRDMIRFSIAIGVETQNSAEGPININIKLKFHLFTAIFSTGAAVIIGHNKNIPIVQSLIVPEVLLGFDISKVISTSHY